MGPVAKDLQRHLSDQLQETMTRHAVAAAGVIDQAELFTIMIRGGLDAVSCAIASFVATVGQSEGVDRALVEEMTQSVAPTLISRTDTIFEKASRGVADRTTIRVRG